MGNIQVQCRLTPDMVEGANGYAPEVYYNLLVTSANESGKHLPATVRFRARKPTTNLGNAVAALKQTLP